MMPSLSLIHSDTQKPSCLAQVLFLGCVLTFSAETVANVKSKPVNPSQPISSLKNLSSVDKAALQSLSIKLLKTPTVQSFKTSKGMTVYFVQANELPIVDVRVTFNAGSARDPAIGKEFQGTASLTAAMLTKGTSKKDEEAIATQVENLGISLSSKAYKDMFVLSLRSLSADDYMMPATQLLHEVLTDSQFPKKPLERIKAQSIIGLKQAAERPKTLASNAFMKHLYGKHPYALPTSGTLSTVPRITQAQLRAFKKRFLVASNGSIAITGDLSRAQAELLAERITKNLHVGKAAEKLPLPKKPKAKHIHIPFDSNQTSFIFGQLGIDRYSPVVYDLNVANDIFGGGEFHAKLMHELREKRGLTYGAYSGFSPMQVKGPFTMSFSTRNDKAKTALSVTKRTLRKYLRNGATDREINDTKTSMMNKFPLSIATNKSINGWLGMMAFYGFPEDHIENYPLNVASVTPYSVNRAFKDNISSRDMVIVTVGPKKP